ncbi:MAG: hypothetical protein FWE45_02940 [Firmicutes bacterium]|nr:hypothetical protein [Bacillota bacterium]
MTKEDIQYKYGMTYTKARLELRRVGMKIQKNNILLFEYVTPYHIPPVIQERIDYINRLNDSLKKRQEHLELVVQEFESVRDKDGKFIKLEKFTIKKSEIDDELYADELMDEDVDDAQNEEYVTHVTELSDENIDDLDEQNFVLDCDYDSHVDEYEEFSKTYGGEIEQLELDILK